MIRLLTIVLFWALAAVPVRANAPDDLGTALLMMRSGDWAGAADRAARAGDVAADLIEWHRLRAAKGSFAEAEAFLKRRSDWPGLKLLRRRSEASIPRNASLGRVQAFFAAQPPQTGLGALRLGEALIKAGSKADGQATLIAAWKTLPMKENVAEAYIDRHGRLLAKHHEARLDRLLWEGNAEAAERLIPLVSSGWQKLAAARIALRGDKNGVDALISQVPEALRTHPGLSYERFQWRARKGRDAGAVELLLAHSLGPEGLGRAEAWADRRRVLARKAMRAGDHVTAYRIAASHGLESGSAYADLEWLSGYLALRFMQAPDRALSHFRLFRRAVATPISLGRAGYWEGRAHEALGDNESARAAYAFGAEYQTSFYGLLAAEKIGAAMDPKLTGRESFPALRSLPLVKSSVFAAGDLLLKAGERDLSERFFVHLSERLSREEQGALATYAAQSGEPHIGLMVAKQAARMGWVIEGPYFPVTDLAERDLPVASELALAIARRESEFDPKVISHAGARGLMQLMPRTAQTVARSLSLPYQLGDLTRDPEYNATLGTAYLADLIEEFGDAPVLVAAGYNAGPSRPTRWIGLYGDPRSRRVDAVDWIEHIPFRETRNYVMRVMESLPVYRARISGKTAPLALSAELK